MMELILIDLMLKILLIYNLKKNAKNHSAFIVERYNS